jgi:hypothetical protein
MRKKPESKDLLDKIRKLIYKAHCFIDLETERGVLLR